MWHYVNTRPQSYETISDLSEYITIDSSWDYSVGNLEGIRIVEGLEARPVSQSKRHSYNRLKVFIPLSIKRYNATIIKHNSFELYSVDMFPPSSNNENLSVVYLNGSGASFLTII